MKIRTNGFLPLALLLVAVAAPALAGVVGHVDSPVSNGAPFPGSIPVRGWTLVPGAPAQLQVRVVENGNMVGGGFANLYNAQTAQQFGPAYAYRGFDFPINLPQGDHFLTIFGVDPMNGASVPLDPCGLGPIHVQVSSGGGGGGMLRGAFTAPVHGQPTTSSFDLEGFLVDDMNPSRTVSGVIRYRSDVDAERSIPVTANVPRSDVGPHGFRVHMTLTTSRHWYMNLYATDMNNCQMPVGMLNLDLVCPTANAGPAVTLCAGGSATIGTPMPILYGDPWSYRWSPTAGLSDAAAAMPVASPASTTTYTLVVTDPAGACSATASTTVTVVALAVSATSLVPGCAPGGGVATVSLGGSATGAAGFTYDWDFDSNGTWDATGLASPATTHDYAAGSWTATLRANSSGATACSKSATTAFTVAACPAPTGCAPRSVGYWSHQFDGDSAQQERACDWLGAIEAASPVFFEALDPSSDRCAQAQSILQTGGGEMFDRAVRQLLGLRLNVASGKISASRGISLSYSTSTTVGAAIAEVEAILVAESPSASELERAKNVAEALDLGCGYSPACENPDSTCEPTVTASKATGGQVLLEWNADATLDYLVDRSSGVGLATATIPVNATWYLDAGGDDLTCWVVRQP